MTASAPNTPEGLAPVEQVELLLRWLGRAIEYSRGRRSSFRAASSVTKVSTLMEERLHQFHGLAENLRMEVAKAQAGGVTRELVDEYYATYRGIWDSSGQRWLEFRKAVEQG
jgi:hypothetical protein